MLSVPQFFGVAAVLLISDAEKANSVVRRDCASKYPTVCPYVQLAKEANDRALNFTRHLKKEFHGKDKDIIDTLLKAEEYLKTILEGRTTNLTSELINALELELVVHEYVFVFCQDETTCEVISIQIGKSIENLIMALERADPEMAGDIYEKYNDVFGKKGSRTGKYADDITYVGEDVSEIFDSNEVL
ncbi:hypothetical protein Q1695_004316 [Nippostrongylus brasiliensis]|nr:hypothetical protein Q1695_004316 [Nippostrongylus brasiliensis]